jgi:3',5'-cyclic AMP phosphodiesterase CpdA
VSARILHVSDLHAGIREHPDVEAAVAALVERVQPELVVASGDLSHRGRRAQLERAHRFLVSLGPPVLAVPGNHDLPHAFPARFVHPWTEFERLWETVEPTHASASLHVVGLNSARPYRHQSGALRADQLRRAAERLGEAADGAYRVVVLHHHLLGAPWRAARKRPLARRSEVLRVLASAGADLILGGHIHQAALGERHEFEVVDADARATVISVAPGFGQPRPDRLGEARGLHLYEIGDDALTAHTYLWDGRDLALSARRTFPRGRGPLAG